MWVRNKNIFNSKISCNYEYGNSIDLKLLEKLNFKDYYFFFYLILFTLHKIFIFICIFIYLFITVHRWVMEVSKSTLEKVMCTFHKFNLYNEILILGSTTDPGPDAHVSL